MKKITTLMCAVALWCSAQAQAPALHFGRDGKFRIAQFTDVHLDLGTPYRRAQAEKTIAQMRYILDAEHPDLVVFTGDVVTGKPAAQAWHRVLEPVAERNLPFCVVLGNHDARAGSHTRGDRPHRHLVCRHAQYARRRGRTGRRGAGDRRDEETYGVALLPRLARLFNNPVYRRLRLVYSGAGGLVSCPQRRLYRGQRRKPLPALAFFHIALPEYVAAWRNPDNTHVGRAAEDECPGALNPGMFAAMVECGDVMGTFVGHDHDIDYVVAEKGIALGYGRFSGDDTTYNNLAAGGAHPRADRGRARLRDVDTRARRPGSQTMWNSAAGKSRKSEITTDCAMRIGVDLGGTNVRCPAW